MFENLWQYIKLFFSIYDNPKRQLSENVEILYPLSSDLPDFANMSEVDATNELKNRGFRDFTFEYFSGAKQIILWTAVRLPTHKLDIDEERFLRLLIISVSLLPEEKARIVEAIPQLTQQQLDELITILEEEGRKFAALDSQHRHQLDALNNKHFDDWRRLEQNGLDGRTTAS